MDYQKILKGIHQEIEPYATIGKQALTETIYGKEWVKNPRALLSTR